MTRRSRPHSRDRGRAIVSAVLVVGSLLAWVPARAITPAHDHTAHDHTAHEHGGGGHEGEGFALRTADAETVTQGEQCAPGERRRTYRVVAINADITLNRYLDHDPEGRMYVLEGDLEAVRREVAVNESARESDSVDPAVSLGLQGDAIEPLTLRALPGDCLQIRLRNELANDEPASLHVHGTSFVVAKSGRPATAANSGAVARRGRTVVYEWAIPDDEPEGTHYFHSHGSPRLQTSHGLFGAVIVEPPGSSWTDPLTGEPSATGWAAIIRLGDGTAFREFALYYHELGDETFQPLDRDDRLVPQVDPLTHIYRPAGRALNYRSEPFMNRLALQQAAQGRTDESLEYSSYAFGDPATPIMRTYLGDPVKQRVIHGGSEVFHVHHVHGGGIRWRREFGAEDGAFAKGLDKRPPLLPGTSERTDSTSIGPSETFDLADECGAGGCQQSVGDFMFHCHVTHHYFAGMWGIWRVYNTLQDGTSSTDTLPALRPLPDRHEAVAGGVTSDALAGTTVDWYGEERVVDNVEAWVGAQLPPRGVPAAYDASVFDWHMDGTRAMGEPETAATWPGYRPRAPGDRPALLFDPKSGKLAYPFLRPHLFARPPFAPGHGPAPYLDPFGNDRGPPPPGANGPASLCPSGTRPREFAINGVAMPAVQSVKENVVDSRGQMYVLRDELDRARAEPSMRRPLTLRTNASEDCVDVLYRSEFDDSADDPFNKTGIHVHFMQFDVQASDGVNLGFNYEQTVRPYALAGHRTTAPAHAGATTISVDRAADLRVGATVGVGMDMGETFETAEIASITGDLVSFTAPLEFGHALGEYISTEFVRYRWYPDVQFGTAFFHDHVNVPYSGRHGLYGAIVSEPPGSTWHEPRSGAELRSGPLADVRSSAALTREVDGSFREVVLGLQDDNPLSHLGRSTGSAVSGTVEPLDARRATASDPSELFSSRAYGDPETPLLEAYLGDPLAFRTLVGANNEVHSFHLDGHAFRSSAHPRARPANNATLGISERLDLVVPEAGGTQRMPGDYLWYNGRSLKFREGSWGLLRVYGPAEPSGGLQKLPGRETTPVPAAAVCPSDAPRREFHVSAIDAPLPMLDGKEGKIFVLDGQRRAVQDGEGVADPLVLHVDVGDCIEVSLTNRTTGGPVSFHADLLAADPQTSAGVGAGRNAPQATAVGATRSYELYASPELGEVTAMVRDFGDVLVNPGLGLYGAVVVGPPGAKYFDSTSGVELLTRAGWRVDVHPPDSPPRRDVTLFFQDEDEGIGNHRMPYTAAVDGPVAINYRTAPIAPRLTRTRDPSAAFSAGSAAGPPATPVIDVRAGDPTTLRVLSPWSEQAQVFNVEGHRWRAAGLPDGPLVASATLGALDVLHVELEGGAGGAARLPGDYLFGNHREPYREAGQWGVLRVHECDADTRVTRLRSCADARSPSGLWALGAGVGGAALLGGGVFATRRRGLGTRAEAGRPDKAEPRQ